MKTRSALTTTLVLGAIVQMTGWLTGMAQAQCTLSAPSNLCAPGGGPKPSDCHVEWLFTPMPKTLVNGVPVADAVKGVPNSRIICYEGDPRCDVDPSLSNKSCTFQSRLCINNGDPRLPKCTPSNLNTFEVRQPNPLTLQNASDLANIATLEAQAGAGGFGVTVMRGVSVQSAGVPNATANDCSSPFDLVLPMLQDGSGRAKRTVKRLRIQGTDTNGVIDPDFLKLDCRPSTCGDGIVQVDHETCDDGNRINGDGCDQACQLQTGPTATVTETRTITATPTITNTGTVTNTPTITGTPTDTVPVPPTNTPTNTITRTPTRTPTNTVPVPPTASPSPTNTINPTKLLILQPGGGSNGSCRGVCSGGIVPGSSCANNAECRVCQGGVNAGRTCTANANCPGSTCPAGGTCSAAKSCSGGPYNGVSCTLASDCNGCNPNLICSGAGVPLACCTGPDQGNCPLSGSCAIIQNRVTLGGVFPILLPLNGVCVPRVSPAVVVADPDVHCTTNSECSLLGKTCQLNQLSLVVGSPDVNGEAPLTIPQSSLQLTPAVVTALGVACVSAGGNGIGTIDCDGGRLNLNSSFSSDHNTTPGDPNNSGSSLGLADDATCSNTFTQGGGNISLSCEEAAFCVGGSNAGLSCVNSIVDCPGGGTCTQRGELHCSGGVNAGQACTVAGDCPGASCAFCSSGAQSKALHNGACNSPTVIAQGGTFGAGDISISIPLALLVLQNTADYGPDKLPCTVDDVGTASPVGVALTTGKSSINVYDVDNNGLVCQGGPQHGIACTMDADCTGGGRCTTNRITASSQASCSINSTCASGEVCVDTTTSQLCSGGTCACREVCQRNPGTGALTTCVTELNGTGLSCPNLNAGTLSGLKFGGGFPAFDTTANDIATLFQFVAQ